MGEILYGGKIFPKDSGVFINYDFSDVRKLLTYKFKKSKYFKQLQILTFTSFGKVGSYLSRLINEPTLIVNYDYHSTFFNSN